MSHLASSPHQAARARRARVAYREYLGGEAERQRAEQIAALPTVRWKGRRLKTIRCHGTTGKGPHDCNVPEGLLWALISLSGFHCAYHPRELQSVEVTA